MILRGLHHLSSGLIAFIQVYEKALMTGEICVAMPRNISEQVEIRQSRASSTSTGANESRITKTERDEGVQPLLLGENYFDSRRSQGVHLVFGRVLVRDHGMHS